MSTLVDTGPLVALLDRTDAHHAECRDLLESLSGRLFVPITVVVEVCWLVRERPDVEAALLDAVAAASSS